MTRIVCPTCEASLSPGTDFDQHMRSEHPHDRSVGFGHTLWGR